MVSLVFCVSFILLVLRHAIGDNGKLTVEKYSPRGFHVHSGLFNPLSLDPKLDHKNGFPCSAPISRLRVEKIEGGIVVAGVVVAANCQVALPVFGFLFILIGIVLTVASYRGPGQDEEPENYAARIAFTGNSRTLGPACIVVGIVMLATGVLLCFLAKRARRKERRVGFHCPIHGDFYPQSPIAGFEGISKTKSSWSFCFRRAGNFQGLQGIANSVPQCPHTQVSSTRSSFSAPVSPCPTPMPFLVTTNSISSDLVISIGANLSPDRTFGSIRSLSVSREVASFPLSRTPSPPNHLPERSCSLSDSAADKNKDLILMESNIMESKNRGSEENEGDAEDVSKVMESPQFAVAQNKSAELCDSQQKNFLIYVGKGSRKSVSIVLPNEDTNE